MELSQVIDYIWISSFIHSFRKGMYYISLIGAADKAVNKTYQPCFNGAYILEQGGICK